MTTNLFRNMALTGVTLVITVLPIVWMCCASYGFNVYHEAIPVISENTMELLITLYFAWIVILGGFLGFALTKSEDK